MGVDSAGVVGWMRGMEESYFQSEGFGELFPEAGEKERGLLARYEELLRDWNGRINLVSRKDMEELAVHHLLHSLALAKVMPLGQRSRVLDIGTGGGLPGIPLAILFPVSRFFLVDSIAKKARAVESMVAELGLKNVEVVNKRAEKIESKFDFLTGRAVATIPQLVAWAGKNLRSPAKVEGGGFYYLKGTRYADELAACGMRAEKVWEISEWFPQDYFREKLVVKLSPQTISRG